MMERADWGLMIPILTLINLFLLYFQTCQTHTKKLTRIQEKPKLLSRGKGKCSAKEWAANQTYSVRQVRCALLCKLHIISKYGVEIQIHAFILLWNPSIGESVHKISVIIENTDLFIFTSIIFILPVFGRNWTCFDTHVVVVLKMSLLLLL